MDNKEFTPITILLIEDNPTQEGIKARDLKARGVDIGSLNEGADVPGINFKREGNRSLHHLFLLKVLQHPEEIKEYITNCLEKEDVEGPLALGRIEGAVPEIVEFDYKLSDNFQINSEHGNAKNIKYYTKYDAVRRHFNPNFLFNSPMYLEKEENINYTLKDFIERINDKINVTGKEPWYKKDEKDLMQRDDELGLYAGVEITRLFRNHTCIGIPATFNFNLRERLHAFGKFYEWINDHDLGTMFSRKERGVKDWDSLIGAAVYQLRTRIETQVQSGRAIPSYVQVSSLAEGVIANPGIFSFETIYGRRDLPLDGLFIDIDKNERVAAIREWAGRILTKLPITNKIINKAIETSTTLWDTYLESFEDRIVLSDYLARAGTLNAREVNYLAEVKKRLAADDTTGLLNDECSIRSLMRAEKNKHIKRLSILLTIAKAAIALEKQRLESNFDEKYAVLTVYEYVNILFPKVNFKNTALLSVNVTDKDKHTESERKWLSDNVSVDTLSKVNVGDLFLFEKWVLKSEKEVIQSIFYEDKKYFPFWLK